MCAQPHHLPAHLTHQLGRSCLAFLEVRPGAAASFHPGWALGSLPTREGQVGELASESPACSDSMRAACRVSLSTSCLLSIRRFLKDSRCWRGRSQAEPWLSWPSSSTTGSTLPTSVSHHPSGQGGFFGRLLSGPVRPQPEAPEATGCVSCES